MSKVITSISALKAADAAKGGYFFSKGAMNMFQSRIVARSIANTPYSTKGYFVTSEVYGEGAPRHFSVRSFDAAYDGIGLGIRTVGDEYATEAEAVAAARFLAGR